MAVNKSYIKRRVRKAAYAMLYGSGVLAHKTHVNWSKVQHITCQEGELKVLHQCSNNLYRVKTVEAEGYFRPVLPHTDLDTCVRKAVKDYFIVMYPEQSVEWVQLKKTLASKEAFRRLLHVGNYSDPYSAARKFYLTKDTSVVGIETPSALVRGTEEWKAFIWNIDHFLKYVMNTIGHHRRNRKGGKWEFSNANRQMATEAMARLVGLGYMFPHSEFVMVTTPSGESMRGTLMANAEGELTEGITAERSKTACSPALQRELMKLNVLDTITYERDHRPGNYNIILDGEGKATGLSVFDNDAEMTFAPLPASTHSGSGSSCLVGVGINRPFMDADLANKIQLLKKEDVRKALKSYLNKIQIFMCWRRILSLKKAISISSNREGFLLKNEQWSEETVAIELSGKYGRTYLDTFVNNERYNIAFVEYNHAAPV